jgi:high-affinity K+ transport system ATPase subunit B
MVRDRVSIVYGVADLAAASLYLLVFFKLAPSRSTAFTVLATILSGVVAAGGVGLLVRTRWGRWIATGASLVMLLACFVLILLLVSSAAYLHGIYDGVGQAGAIIALVVAALAVEVVGLLPALQLAHLRRLARSSEKTS